MVDEEQMGHMEPTVQLSQVLRASEHVVWRHPFSPPVHYLALVGEYAATS